MNNDINKNFDLVETQAAIREFLIENGGGTVRDVFNEFNDSGYIPNEVGVKPTDQIAGILNGMDDLVKNKDSYGADFYTVSKNSNYENVACNIEHDAILRGQGSGDGIIKRLFAGENPKTLIDAGASKGTVNKHADMIKWIADRNIAENATKSELIELIKADPKKYSKDTETWNKHVYHIKQILRIKSSLAPQTQTIEQLLDAGNYDAARKLIDEQEKTAIKTKKKAELQAKLEAQRKIVADEKAKQQVLEKQLAELDN